MGKYPWEVASWENILGKLPLVAAWENAFGKLPLGKMHLGKYLTYFNLYITIPGGQGGVNTIKFCKFVYSNSKGIELYKFVIL